MMRDDHELGSTTVYSRLNLLSDPARVRLLKLLEEAELGVGELSKIVNMPQSSVSRHLKMLSEAGWVQRRSVGTATLVHMAVERLPASWQALWGMVRAEVQDSHPDDMHRMESIVALRSMNSKQFFEAMAGRWDGLRRDLFGDSFLLPTLLTLLSPDSVIADLGCGTGQALSLLAPVVNSLIGVDRESEMLARAGERLAGMDNVSLRRGGLDALPIDAQSVDVALCMLVLHHVDDLGVAGTEVARILRPGGRLLVLDMVPHQRSEFRHTMGHRHCGFSKETLGGLGASGCLRMTSYRRLPCEPQALGPDLFVATLVCAPSSIDEG